MHPQALLERREQGERRRPRVQQSIDYQRRAVGRRLSKSFHVWAGDGIKNKIRAFATGDRRYSRGQVFLLSDDNVIGARLEEARPLILSSSDGDCYRSRRFPYLNCCQADTAARRSDQRNLPLFQLSPLY